MARRALVRRRLYSQAGLNALDPNWGILSSPAREIANVARFGRKTMGRSQFEWCANLTRHAYLPMANRPVPHEYLSFDIALLTFQSEKRRVVARL
jgi:hypothetical protein